MRKLKKNVTIALSCIMLFGGVLSVNAADIPNPSNTSYVEKQESNLASTRRLPTCGYCGRTLLKILDTDLKCKFSFCDSSVVQEFPCLCVHTTYRCGYGHQWIIDGYSDNAYNN